MVPVFIAQLKRHQPPLAIMENVANLCGKKHVGYLCKIVQKIEEEGYKVKLPRSQHSGLRSSTNVQTPLFRCP